MVKQSKEVAYKALKKHYQQIKKQPLQKMFAKDPDRFQTFSRKCGPLFVDFSKNHITAKTLHLLLDLARACELKKKIQAMFTGKKINKTENRSVLHTALRADSESSLFLNGKDIMPKVKAVLSQMEAFAGQVRAGTWKGYTGRAIQSVVHIGIGGSHLGPRMAVSALAHYSTLPRIYFVTNIDGADIISTLKDLNPETTLFVIASKTFTTQETMQNAVAARDWFLQAARDKKHISRHFVAVSANKEAVTAFGIVPENMFMIWDFVGGRYSVSSAIGLPVALSCGMEHFKDLLAGAGAMDEHFRTTPFEKNIPVLLALTGVWYNNFFCCETHAVLPYGQELAWFPAYIQQLDMESNGKGVALDGELLKEQTGPIVWGGPGTNSQHAFFQLLHQGKKMVPCDFLAPAIPRHPLSAHHKILLANFLAQPQALMQGKDLATVQAELKAAGHTPYNIKKLAPHKTFSGNRPSTSIVFDKLSPYTLGMLIAMYEHKIFTQGVIWGINSFDQWGVELGKELSQKILKELTQGKLSNNHDSSTAGLLKHILSLQK